jgi:hypothetical protein
MRAAPLHDAWRHLNDTLRAGLVFAAWSARDVSRLARALQVGFHYRMEHASAYALCGFRRHIEGIEPLRHGGGDRWLRATPTRGLFPRPLSQPVDCRRLRAGRGREALGRDTPRADSLGIGGG